MDATLGRRPVDDQGFSEIARNPDQDPHGTEILRTEADHRGRVFGDDLRGEIGRGVSGIINQIGRTPDFVVFEVSLAWEIHHQHRPWLQPWRPPGQLPPQLPLLLPETSPVIRIRLVAKDRQSQERGQDGGAGPGRDCRGHQPDRQHCQAKRGVERVAVERARPTYIPAG
jgi:hypothetical protein